ncbi:MAG: hypothetical protein JWO31_2100 [Phycisphaerales bacterium]|nr:hypothetical protein [Phycisphaerales bacterium]
MLTSVPASSDPPPDPSDPPAAEPARPARPFVPYASNPPPPPVEDDPTTDLLHAAAGAGTYLSLLVAIKVAAVRYRWDVGGVCGAWVVLLIASIGVSGWLAGAHGWRGALVGTTVAVIASFVFSALVLREG